MVLHLTDEQAGLLLALSLIAAAPIAANVQTTEPREPRSCQRLHEETDKCAAAISASLPS
jgi:hypothetical protein